MPSLNPNFSFSRLAVVVLAVLLACVLFRPGNVQAQRNPNHPVAQVGVGSPLPVYMVNDALPNLPEGFVAGSSWKFTTWTTPSTLTFTATVVKTQGAWAQLTVTSGGQTRSSWYYIPHMPGAWDPQ